MTVTIGTVEIFVTTAAGQSAEDVAAALAVAIGLNPALSSLGVLVFASGDRVLSTGILSEATTTDAGLTLNPAPAVPALSAFGLAVLGTLLGLHTWLRRAVFASPSRRTR